MLVADSLPAPIKDRQRRIYIKSKRRRNLFKKSIELKRMCDLKMFFVVQDSEFDKIYIYNTCPGTFTLDYFKKVTGEGADKLFAG